MEMGGLIQSRQAVQRILQEIQSFRGGVGDLVCYDWINIPLVYTQVCSILINFFAIFQLATLSVYAYFLAAVFAVQPQDTIQAPNQSVGLFQLLFYLGWLKVS